jgi:S1-C subfamily serine protease
LDQRSSPDGKDEPAFSGVFSGTFLSLVVVFVLCFYGVRALPRGLLAEDVAPRPVAPRGELGQEERVTVALFESASPAVVQIESSNLFRYRGELQPLEVPEGSGSGFVWDEEGHVVTNLHVVRGGTSFRVRFQDNTASPATVAGIAPDYDLAVLSLEAPRDKLRPLQVGRSSDLCVGQRTFAIGYPFGGEQTLTTGVVSGLDRWIQSQSGFKIYGVIQTDAAINPGNSGGPLLDSAGRLIGVNTAIATATGANTGVGFAVPVDTVNRIVPRILAEGTVERAMLGINVADDHYAVDAGLSGAVIGGLTRGGPADRAGLVALGETAGGEPALGDLIVGIDGREIRRAADLFQALEVYRPGDEVRVKVSRPGRSGRRIEDVDVRLAVLR